MGQCRKFNGPHSPGLVFTPNTTKGTADSTTWGHSPLTAVGHRCGTLWGWQQWPPPPAGTAILLSPGCTAKTPLHCSQPCDHQHLCRWQNLKRQMGGKIPGWADHGAGDVSSRSQRDWTHIYPGLFQCFSWPWGQVLLTAICLMLGNNLKQTSKLFFFLIKKKNVLTAENSCFTIFDIFFSYPQSLLLFIALPHDWVFLPLCFPPPATSPLLGISQKCYAARIHFYS